MVASLIGVLGVLGPAFTRDVLGLEEGDLIVILLPLGAGLLTGIIFLNFVGKLLPRRKLIEGGMVALAASLVILGIAQNFDPLTDGDDITALLAVVVVVAYVAGVCYAFVAVPAQTSLQEELPSDVRGRVFGVLNMLVSLASFVPIIIVGPLADVIGAATVIVISALIVGVVGCALGHLRAPPGHRNCTAPQHRAGRPDDHHHRLSTLNRPIRLRYIAEDVEANAAHPDDRQPGRSRQGWPGPGEATRRVRWLSRPRVVVIFTGGTIAMLPDPVSGAAVPSLDGAEILARVRGLDRIAALESIDWGLVPASHLRFSQLLEIGRLIANGSERDPRSPA